ncbi:hypothetical protein NBRC116586_22870 [Pseudooceanicola nitratireducens]|uniref:hypothetical protein n=1 Tax=Pseudooceanicola nitratireducens TaxID=517719 RepID=UPI003103D11A
MAVIQNGFVQLGFSRFPAEFKATRLGGILFASKDQLKACAAAGAGKILLSGDRALEVVFDEFSDDWPYLRFKLT